jgi:parvulin-like peptidyl-prolyl isomerase
MKRFFTLLVISMSLFIVLPVFGQLEIKQGDELYVKQESENIRLSPNGTVICKLPQGTKVIALAEQGNWVAVQLVGYVWKPSLSDSRFKIEGYNIRAYHILLHTDAEANEIKALLDKGSDFRQLAKDRSKGPNADKGGDLGIINKGDLMPELDGTLSKLKVGEISDVVQTKMGFHVFMRYE